MRKIYIIIFTIFILVNIFSDGFIIIHNLPQRENPFPLEVKDHYVNVDIFELTAITNIEQTFYNPNSRRLEGTYLFPVPRGAVIQKFSMVINGKEVIAELLDAKKAKKIYEDIVRAQLDPAILEYDGLDLFKVRIFPIEPLSEKKIKISYTEILKKDFGTVEYIYPLNTEKFSSKPLKDLVIKVNLKTDSEIKNIYSTSHNIDIVRKDNTRAIISYEENNTKPDIDFKLYYSTLNSKIGISIIPYKEERDDGFFFLNISPGYEIDENQIEAKDVTFVFDNSGSMQGDNLIQAKRALDLCISNLREKDRFEVIRFSTDAEALFSSLKEGTNENKKRAKEFIESINAIGGTNIEEALKLALQESNDDRLHIIVFITDGKPTIGETNEDKLLKLIEKSNINKIRIFTFGIGYEINTHLLDKITELTNGYRVYIIPEENIEVKISNFFIKVNSPILTNISIDFGTDIKVKNIYPNKISDIFKGGSVSLTGRYSKSGKTTITLKGTINKKEVIFKYDFTFPQIALKDPFIANIWATRRIGYLLDYMRLHKEEKELIEEITSLAKKYGIITPYTSYLIVEDEINRINKNELSEKYQTINNYKRSNQNRIIEERKRYDQIKKEKSGEDSVKQSIENQYLSDIESLSESRVIENIDESFNQNYKNIQGRAIYQVDNYWVDSNIQILKPKKEKKIKFASEEYFGLYRNNPLISQFLALGKNVIFVFNDIIYEIYE